MKTSKRVRASLAAEDDVVVATPVHTVLTLVPEGGEGPRHTVLCPRRGETVDIAACHECGHARSIPSDPIGRGAVVDCAPELPSVRLYDTRDRANATLIGACMRPTTAFVV